MKKNNFLPILILVFVIATFFALKNDLLQIPNSIKNQGGILGIVLDKNPVISLPNINFETIKQEVGKTFAKIELPGPLRKFIGGGSGQGTLTAEGIISATNTERRLNGNLSLLSENEKLDRSSQQKVADMFAKQYFEHVSPAGVAITDLAKTNGYQYVIIGENLALGDFQNDQAVVDAWMASPGHRANILNPRYSEIGVSVMKGLYNGQEVWMAVQHFGLPLSSCPPISETTKSDITLKENNISNLEVSLSGLKSEIDRGEGDVKAETDSYNALVETYNSLITALKSEIATFNAEVAKFNACIGG